MGFDGVGISRILMERLNDHRHVHNQCARLRGCVLYMYFMTGQNIFMMAAKACIEPRAFIRE